MVLALKASHHLKQNFSNCSPMIALYQNNIPLIEHVDFWASASEDSQLSKFRVSAGICIYNKPVIIIAHWSDLGVKTYILNYCKRMTQGNRLWKYWVNSDYSCSQHPGFILDHMSWYRQISFKVTSHLYLFRAHILTVTRRERSPFLPPPVRKLLWQDSDWLA